MSRALRFFAIALLSLATPAAAAPIHHASITTKALSTGPTVVNPSSMHYPIVFNDDGTVPNWIPADPTSERKFPKEDPRVVDALQFVQMFIDTQVEYVSDDEHYGVDEYWVMAPTDNQGDCEDFALTKLYMLAQSNIDEVADTKLVFVLVHDYPGNEGGGHAILAVRMPNGSVAYLDQRFNHLMTRAELQYTQGYEFFDW
jgi:predicted transglutaminase-like cysteine proteinase